MNKIIKSICIVFIITILFNVVLAAEDYESYEKELQTIKKRLENNSSNLEGIEREINILLIEICDIDAEIAKVESEKQKVEVKTETTQKEINENKEKIEELNKIVETDTLYYEQRLRQIYENGTLDFWDVLFTSKNFIDFIKRYNILISIIGEDKILYTNLTTKQTSLNKAKETIEVKSVELENLKKNRDKKMEELLEEKAKRQDIIYSLENDKEKAEAQTKLLQQQEVDLNIKLEDEIKKMIEQHRATTGTVSGTPNSAGFIWPVGGTGGIVTATFPKYPDSFGGGRHDGLDIASRSPDPIRACKKGKVLKVVADRPFNTYPYSMQYGNYIIILHEDGVTTSLYGHLSSAIVRKGDDVETGQQIGVIGNSGYSTGQHLHFEVRINGAPQDPYSYVSK